ncbi:hypothetical protein ASE69_03520 [Sphingomonas sp. Leaf208]|uniref:HK97 gp10 family phage protein n=1 Tax=Sphingomonas sp. Leaf208 TaxID=1735679 RepID=UPI0006F79E82|nr:HK97 gp10 family phage protein [Sphingomonas sp. Leaf208]KQM56695.1 hypothetical protein ASE69_03520 [Sphingomonas sp. Leaf208]
MQRRRNEVPDKIRKILRGAARAGATVIADDAKQRVASDAVREGVIIGRSKEVDERITVKIAVKEGWARSLGTWLEYGTSAHFISVDPNFAEGRTAARVNKLDTDAAKEGRSGPGATLVINGKPVGATVFHPGTSAEPWLRTARDVKARDAIQTAQEYITTRVKRSTPTTDGEV